MGLVETELRRRATARGLHIGATLPEGALSWVPYLLKRFLRDAMRREAALAVAHNVSLFVDAEDRLLTCGTENVQPANINPRLLLGHDWGPNVNPNEPRYIGPPTLVPSMQGRRIVSVAASDWHCLALSYKGRGLLVGRPPRLARPRRRGCAGGTEPDRFAEPGLEHRSWAQRSERGGR